MTLKTLKAYSECSFCCSSTGKMIYRVLVFPPPAGDNIHHDTVIFVCSQQQTTSSSITLATLYSPLSQHHCMSDLAGCPGPLSAEEDVAPLAHRPTTVPARATGSNTDQCASRPAWEPRRRRGSLLPSPPLVLPFSASMCTACRGGVM